MQRLHGFSAFVGAFFVLIGSSSGLGSTPIPVANPSFEEPALAPGASLNTPIPDWSNTLGASRGVWHSAGFVPGTHLNQIGQFFQNGAVAQNLGHSILPDTTYTVEYLFGWGGGGLTGVIELYAGGTVLDGTVVGGTLLAFDLRPVNPGGNFTMEEFSFNWTSPSSGGPVGQTLSIRLGRFDTFSVSSVTFDNIRVSYVPEPTSAIMLAGAFSLLLIRRR